MQSILDIINSDNSILKEEINSSLERMIQNKESLSKRTNPSILKERLSDKIPILCKNERVFFFFICFIYLLS
jgi:TATA-binding protein-associated factor Taf7